jgi:hypothetical protein
MNSERSLWWHWILQIHTMRLCMTHLNEVFRRCITLSGTTGMWENSMCGETGASQRLPLPCFAKNVNRKYELFLGQKVACKIATWILHKILGKLQEFLCRSKISLLWWWRHGFGSDIYCVRHFFCNSRLVHYSKSSHAFLKGVMLVNQVIPCSCYCQQLLVFSVRASAFATMWKMFMRYDQSASFVIFVLRFWLFFCVRWTLTFSLVIMEYRFQTWIGSPMVTPKDALDKCIKMRNKKNVLWCFVHQSIKGDTMINSKRSCIRTVIEEVNHCFTWVSTKSASRIHYPFQAMWVNTTALNFAHTPSQS